MPYSAHEHRETAQSVLEVQKEYHIDAVTEDIYRVMKEKGISKADLARIMDTSPANITQILDGTRNFTLGKLVDISLALDAKLDIAIRNRSRTGECCYFYYSPFSFGSEDQIAEAGQRSGSAVPNEGKDPITLKEVVLKELTFKRVSLKTEPADHEFSTEIGICPIKEKKYAEVLIKTSISGKRERNIQIDCSVLGIFHIESETLSSESIDRFLHVEAPVLLYPHVDEIVQEISSCAVTAPLKLPQYDFEGIYAKMKTGRGRRYSS